MTSCTLNLQFTACRSFSRGTNHHKKMITFLNNKLLMSPVQYLAHEEVICIAWFEEDGHSVLKTYKQ